MTVARELNDALETYRSGRLNRWIIGTTRSGASRVLTGLGPLLVGSALGALGLWFSFGLPTTCAVLTLGCRSWNAVAAGAVGASVSLLVRLNDFNRETAQNPFVLVLTGFVKPLVGVAFALAAVAAISAGIVPLRVGPDAGLDFYWSVAFVTGFSERLAHDVLGSVDGAATRGTR